VRWSRSSPAGVASAVTAISASAIPSQTSGRETRSAARPPMTLPSANPAMKTAQTVLAA
jgi:hypothetical protein